MSERTLSNILSSLTLILRATRSYYRDLHRRVAGGAPCFEMIITLASLERIKVRLGLFGVGGR